MTFLNDQQRREYETTKPRELKADIWMISGCEDKQTSADVSNIATFQLPDPAGRSGGACTAALLNVLHEDKQCKEDTYTFTEVLTKMRTMLKGNGFTQIPQLSSTRPIDMNEKFKMVPEDTLSSVTCRAVMVGINYTGQKGELRGCHNDVFSMYKHLQTHYGFNDKNFTLLIDDGDHTAPTKANMIAAYKNVVRQSKPGDSIFLQFSGHGTRVPDLNGDEEDGYDEALVPLDYESAGMVLDDDLYDIFVKGLPSGVHVISLMDCCHSGSIMDLPYIFKANGKYDRMEIEDMDLDKFFAKITGNKYFKKIGKEIGNKIANKIGGKVGREAVNGIMKQFFK
jgi:hypothetical protein